MERFSKISCKIRALALYPMPSIDTVQANKPDSLFELNIPKMEIKNEVRRVQFCVRTSRRQFPYVGCSRLGNRVHKINKISENDVITQHLSLNVRNINEHAAVATQSTAQQNKICLNPVVCDLVKPLADRLENAVDVLLFNPPYVVTPSDEVGSHGIEASWAGGVNGREVMDRLFPLIPRLLSDRGIFYLVTVKENDIEDIECQLRSYGLQMTTVLSRRSGAEFLTVTKFTKERKFDV